MSAVDPARIPADDSGLVRAALAGDRTAFEALARPHLVPLRHHVRHALRGKTEFDIDEVVQQTLVRAYLALDMFDPRYRFGQYLFGIAKYIVRRQLCAVPREAAMDWAAAPGAEFDLDRLATEAATRAPAALRALAGVERFAPPDACTLDRAVFHELLTAVLAHGGYPHQQLAFAFGTVVWGKGKAARPRLPAGARRRPDKVPLTSDPDRVVRELSAVPLRELRHRLAQELATGSEPGGEVPPEIFAALDYRLDLSVGALFAADVVSSRRAAALSDRRVGGTTLADYYGADPRKSVADWIGAVKKRALRHLTGRTDPLRSPLPWPPGHGNLPSSR